MSFNLDRALKRANKFLKIVKDIMNNFEEIKNNQRNMEWVISNCDILQEEMEIIGYGRGAYDGSNYYDNIYIRNSRNR